VPLSALSPRSTPKPGVFSPQPLWSRGTFRPIRTIRTGALKLRIRLSWSTYPLGGLKVIRYSITSISKRLRRVSPIRQRDQLSRSGRTHVQTRRNFKEAPIGEDLEVVLREINTFCEIMNLRQRGVGKFRRSRQKFGWHMVYPCILLHFRCQSQTPLPGPVTGARGQNSCNCRA
jgi:hypothetical protein